MARDHDGGRIPPPKTTETNKKFEGVKKTPYTARAIIRSVVADMEEEDKKKVFDGMMEDADF